MPRRSNRGKAPPGQSGTRGVLELDRFTGAELDRWAQVSRALDELHGQLYYGFEAQRSADRAALTEAILGSALDIVECEKWCRIVSHRFSLDPLSSTGSLFREGGRFNVGRDLPLDVRAPWPALYLAADQETALRERSGISREGAVGGLSPEELALLPKCSYTLVTVNARLSRVFDLTDLPRLAPLCKVLSKFKMPAAAEKARARLRIDRRKIMQVRSPLDLQRVIMASDWRKWPVQFDLPAPGQILGGLVLAAGCEAIRYPSSKSGEACLAVFPQNFYAHDSFIELADAAPEETKRLRLDADSRE